MQKTMMQETVITVGRSSSHILLPYDGIENRHAELAISHVDNNQVRFTDLSNEGTIVGNEVVCNQTRMISRGTRVIFNAKPKPISLDWSKVPVLPDFKDFSKKITIGRDPKNDVVLDAQHTKTGRSHALLLLKKGRYYLYDQSQNGSRINDIPVQRFHLTPVKRSDKLAFAGQCELDWSKIPAAYPPKVPAYLLGAGLLLALLLWIFIPKNCENPDQYKALIIRTWLYKLTVDDQVYYVGENSNANPPYRVSEKKETLTPFVIYGTGFSAMNGKLVTNHHVAVPDLDLEKDVRDGILQAVVGYIYKQNVNASLTDITEAKFTYDDVQLYAVKDGQTIDLQQLEHPDGPTDVFVKLSFSKGDKEHDLAILNIDDRKRHAEFPFIPPHCFGCEDGILEEIQKAKTGIRYCGYPGEVTQLGQTNGYSVSAACYSGKINILKDDRMDFTSDIVITGGGSGSGVFSEKDNKLIGVAYAGHRERNNLSLVVKGKYLLRLLEQYPEFKHH